MNEVSIMKKGTYDTMVSRMAYLEIELGMAREILREVALPPYEDSDLKSLLETLRARAINHLNQWSKSPEGK